MSPVTLPGDLVSPIAGALLRRGCPVIHQGCTPWARGVFFRMLPPPFVGEAFCWYDAAGSPWPGAPRDSSGDVRLDLSDPAGMDRAARWLAAHHGLVVGATAPGWTRIESWPSGPWWLLSGKSGLTAEEDYNQCKTWMQFSRDAGFAALTDPAEAMRAACLAAVGRTT